MKGVFVIIDGLGDRPCRKLSGKTPLEAAEKPNLDYFSKNGQLGSLYPVHKEFVPGTSEALIEILGQNWQDYPRGWLEALGEGINLEKGDLAFRANFATIDNLKKRNVIDRRVGRTLTTKEARILAKAVNKIFLPRKFIFKPTLQHRAVLVLRGGFSDNITEMDPAHHPVNKSEQGKFRFSSPEDEDENSRYTANMVNNFVEKAFQVLDEHPINQLRRKKGFYPANLLLLRAPGISIKKINKYKKWACSTSIPVMKGVCKALGINLFEFKAVEFRGHDAYKNIKKNLGLELKKSISLLKKKKKHFDYFFIYLKETDVAGHDNKPLQKKDMIELIDKKFFSFLKKFAVKNKIKVAVTTDHATPCELKKHTADPVPFLVYNGERGSGSSFNEIEARKGELGVMDGQEVLKKIGFV
jgi:2,3-bisphosphoglycerate-independent phosphoglycerate mutase